LQSITGILPVCRELTVHQVDGTRTLVGGQPNALPEKKQKYIAMAREHRSQCFSLAFIWSEPLQFFAGAAAAVVAQDRWKRAPALRTPEHSVQGNRSVVHHYRFRSSSGLAGHYYRE
jgi:hypothetical protein